MLVATILFASCDGGGGGSAPVAASITAQPQDQSVVVGSTATFHVSATGTSLTYQWLRDGVAIAGATAADYTTPSLSIVDSGATYTVSVTASTGNAVVSAGGHLSVRGVEFVAGQPNQGPGNRDFRSGQAAFDHPTAMTSGNGWFLVDTDNATIRFGDFGGFPEPVAGSAGLHGHADGIGLAARFDHPMAIAPNPLGGTYVADTGNHVIRLITGGVNNTAAVTTVAGTPRVAGSTDGPAAMAGFNAPQGLWSTPAGLHVADTGNNTIRLIDTAGGSVTTLAGDALAPPGLVDGTGSAARFSGPTGMTRAPLDHVFVADTLNNAIRRITPAGVVTTLAGFSGMPGHGDGDVSTATFFHPTGLWFDQDGALYVADTGNNTVRKIVLATGQVTTIAGDPLQSGYVDGIASRLLQPRGVARIGSRPIIVDTGNSMLREYRESDGAVIRWLGSDPSQADIDAADGVSSRFHDPQGIALDAAGNAYVADLGAGTIRKVTPSGSTTTFAGTAHAFGNADGTGPAARFTQPSGVAIDASANLYVSDLVGTIRKLTPAGVVTTLAGSAATGSADGTGTNATFAAPEDLAVDAAGNVFVADTGNHTIRKITPAGAVTTYAGTAGLRGSLDGTGTAARFDTPVGIAVDANGNVYVADGGNRTIRRITSAGVVTTLAGTPSVYGRADGTGAAAGFARLGGLAVDAAGNAYVADYATIRRVTPAGVVTTAAGTPGVTGFGGDAINPATEVNGMIPVSVPLPASFRTPHQLAVSPRGYIVMTVGDGIVRVGP